MSPRVRLLRQLLERELYAPDPHAVANAILARAQARAWVADSAFANTPAPRPAHPARMEVRRRSSRSAGRRLIH